MTSDEATQLIRQLLLARDEVELRSLVAANLAGVDGTFFATARAAVDELKRSGKPAAAQALQALADHMLSLKTLI